jgi:pimeloyl-ACP methyl ester carboxylesterase
MGGRIGAWMASQRPASTRALVLIAPAALGTIGAPALAASAFFRSALERNLGRYLSDPAFMASTLARAYGRKPSLEETQAYQAPFLRPGAQAEFLSWAATASERKEPPFHAITCPSLILWGTRDRIVRNQGRRLAGLLPSSTYVAYPGGGHVLMETEGEKVSADVLAFLAAQLGP